MAEKISTTMDRFIARSQRAPTPESLAVSRNTSLGAAAACLVVLSQVIQVGAKDMALEVSVIASCVAMPLLIGVATIYELFIYLGSPSYEFMARKQFVSILSAMWGIGGIAVFVTIGGAAYFLSANAFWVLISVTVVAFLVVAAFYQGFSAWWYGSAGPGRDEKERWHFQKLAPRRFPTRSASIKG